MKMWNNVSSKIQSQSEYSFLTQWIKLFKWNFIRAAEKINKESQSKWCYRHGSLFYSPILITIFFCVPFHGLVILNLDKIFYSVSIKSHLIAVSSNLTSWNSKIKRRRRIHRIERIAGNKSY